jgi:hypothetical protein
MTYTPIGNGKTQGYIKVGANRKGWIMVIFLDVYNVRNHDYIIFNLNLLVMLEHLSFSNKFYILVSFKMIPYGGIDKVVCDIAY